MVHSYNGIQSSSVEMNELELCVWVWLNLKTILLSAESELHEDTYCNNCTEYPVWIAYVQL